MLYRASLNKKPHHCTHWHLLRNVASTMWFWILGWFFAILALLGNGFVICLVIFKRSIQTTTNWFIVSLAMADFCAALVFFPVRYISTFFYEIDLSHAGLWYIIYFTCMYCSTTNLCVLTVDRFIAVVKPLKYASLRKRKNVIRLICVAWLTPVIFFTLPEVFLCRGNEEFTLIFEAIRVFIFLVFPCIFFVLVTSRLIYIAHKISRQCAALEAQVRYNYASQQASVIRTIPHPDRRTTAMVSLIILLFNITYSGGIYLCFCFLEVTCVVSATLKNVIYLLFIINVTANPIVYAFFKKDIRKSLLKLFKQIKRSLSRHRSLHPANTPPGCQTLQDVSRGQSAITSEQSTVQGILKTALDYGQRTNSLDMLSNGTKQNFSAVLIISYAETKFP